MSETWVEYTLPSFARIEISTAGHGDSANATICQDLFITKRLHENGANSIYFGKLWGELGCIGGELQRGELATGRNHRNSARSRCKTCLFIVNTSKISGPRRSVKITDRFTCTSANVIYCITCTLCNKLYIGETGRRLGDRFREHLRDVEKNDKDASKPVARHFKLPNHSKKHMAVCGLSLHLGTTESRKNLEQKFIFQIGTLNPHGINECFSFN